MTDSFFIWGQDAEGETVDLKFGHYTNEAGFFVGGETKRLRSFVANGAPQDDKKVASGEWREKAKRDSSLRRLRSE
jgi:hypothetical protein